jgi:hypothetical protein
MSTYDWYSFWDLDSNDLYSFIGSGNFGKTNINKLRDPNKLAEMIQMSPTFLLHVTRLMLNHFRPGEDLRRWYEAEIQERFSKVTSIDYS